MGQAWIEIILGSSWVHSSPTWRGNLREKTFCPDMLDFWLGTGPCSTVKSEVFCAFYSLQHHQWPGGCMLCCLSDLMPIRNWMPNLAVTLCDGVFFSSFQNDNLMQFRSILVATATTTTTTANKHHRRQHKSWLTQMMMMMMMMMMSRIVKALRVTVSPQWSTSPSPLWNYDYDDNFPLWCCADYRSGATDTSDRSTHRDINIKLFV